MTQKCGTHKELHRVKKIDDKYCSLWELPVFLSYTATMADEHLWKKEATQVNAQPMSSQRQESTYFRVSVMIV